MKAFTLLANNDSYDSRLRETESFSLTMAGSKDYNTYSFGSGTNFCTGGLVSVDEDILPMVVV